MGTDWSDVLLHWCPFEDCTYLCAIVDRMRLVPRCMLNPCLLSSFITDCLKFYLSLFFLSFASSMCLRQRPTASGPFTKSWPKAWPLTLKAMSTRQWGMSWRLVSFYIQTIKFLIHICIYFFPNYESSTASSSWVQFSWFFFELIVKSMAHHLVESDKVKVKTS